MKGIFIDQLNKLACEISSAESIIESYQHNVLARHIRLSQKLYLFYIVAFIEKERKEKKSSFIPMFTYDNLEKDATKCIHLFGKLGLVKAKILLDQFGSLVCSNKIESKTIFH